MHGKESDQSKTARLEAIDGHLLLLEEQARKARPPQDAAWIAGEIQRLRREREEIKQTDDDGPKNA